MWDALRKQLPDEFSRWRMALRTVDSLYLWSAFVGLAAAVILIEIGIVMQTRLHGG